MDTISFPQRKSQQKKNCNRKLTDLQVLEAYNQHITSGKTTPQLALELGVTRGSLNKRFKLLNLETVKLYKNTEHSFFHNIDNEIKAYLLGFIYGDGSIARRWNTLNIEVNIKDKYIVELLNQLNSKAKILYRFKGNSTTCKVGISSKMIKEDLLNKGVKVNKTYDGMSIKNVSEEFYPHLIRGFLDADGCVYIRKTNKNLVNLICSSLPFLQQIAVYLETKEIKSVITTVVKPGRIALFKLAIYKEKDVKSFYDLLYSNANYWLKRKREKFIDNTEVTIEPKTSIEP